MLVEALTAGKAKPSLEYVLISQSTNFWAFQDNQRRKCPLNTFTQQMNQLPFSPFLGDVLLEPPIPALVWDVHPSLGLFCGGFLKHLFIIQTWRHASKGRKKIRKIRSVSSLSTVEGISKTNILWVELRGLILSTLPVQQRTWQWHLVL